MLDKLVHGVNSIPVRLQKELNLTTRIGNESDTINRASSQNWESENNSGKSSEGNFTTEIGHESDTLNRVSGQSWENVNKGFLSLKNRTPCPFLLRRGWCVKGNKCDFSHENFPNDIKDHSDSGLDKRSVPCPFLRRKGSCLKGLSCDFFHSDIHHPPPASQSYQNTFQDHYLKQASPFLDKLQNLVSSVDQIYLRVRGFEDSQRPQPYLSQHPIHYHPLMDSQCLFPPPNHPQLYINHYQSQRACYPPPHLLYPHLRGT